MIHVRPFRESDRDFLLGLAPRLAVGIPAWRDSRLMVETVEKWIAGSIEQHGHKTTVFVAENEEGSPLGFATVSHSKHFTGLGQAYIGELATGEAVEGHGVGRALVEACEQWARKEGYRLLSLTTGSANDRALGFYRHLGFHDEDVTLVKILD
jgi:GNAT superfamily N-acetyltransferase